MKSKRLLLALSATCLIPVMSQANYPEHGRAAQSQQAEHPMHKDPDRTSKHLDNDEGEVGNGTYLLRQFDKIDSDGNGELSKEEIREHSRTTQANRAGHSMHKGPHPDRMFKHLDTDESGTISREEAEAGNAAHLLRKFDKIDVDGDGELSKEEFRSAKSKMYKHKKKKHMGEEPTEKDTSENVTSEDE